MDPSQMSKSMMRNCKLAVETKRILDPLAIMSDAFRKIEDNDEVEAGSTTTCVVSIRRDAESNRGLFGSSPTSQSSLCHT